MKSTRIWITYTLIRILIFAIALAGLLLLQMNPVWATVLAAVIGFCVSYIFFRGTRDDLAKDIYQRRHSEQHDVDNDIENEALDRAEHVEQADRAEPVGLAEHAGRAESVGRAKPVGLAEHAGRAESVDQAEHAERAESVDQAEQ
ncbi:MAG: DUF4229 domain-containing protein [Lacisediminihabitans sp.]